MNHDAECQIACVCRSRGCHRPGPDGGVRRMTDLFRIIAVLCVVAALLAIVDAFIRLA
jgi:hypothetical protein